MDAKDNEEVLHSGFLSQNSDEFLSEEEDVSLSGDEDSLTDFEEEDDIADKEDYLQTEDVDDALEANNEDDKKDELFIDKEFSSDVAAYKAYNKYARNQGFDIRKQRRSEKKGKLVRVRYVCSREGFKKERNVKKSKRRVTRCGCNAHMSCYVQSSGRFKITSFNPNHNHDLVRTPMKHMLKVNILKLLKLKLNILKL